jgi:hypothetical protein
LSRSVSDFRKDYQPRTNIVQDENGDLVANCHSILARWRDHFSQLLNVLGVNDVRQTELYTSYPLLAEPSAFEFKKATETLKESNKSPGIDQIPAELIKAGGRTVCCEIHKLINSVWNKEKLPEDWRESIILSIRRVIKQSVIIIEAYYFCKLRTKS